MPNRFNDSIATPSDIWLFFMAWYRQLTNRQRLLIKANFLSALIIWEEFPGLPVEEKIERARERLFEHDIAEIPNGFLPVLGQVFLTPKQDIYTILSWLD